MDEQALTLAVRIARLLQEEAKSDPGGWEIDKPYFIRTVTYHLTGRLVAVTNHELWLEDAAWIADDGRFMQAIEKGEFAEVEPFPSGRRVAVGRGSLIDAVTIASLPRSQK